MWDIKLSSMSLCQYHKQQYARIQTFPDYWEFEGNMADQYKQIGNAVDHGVGSTDHLSRQII